MKARYLAGGAVAALWAGAAAAQLGASVPNSDVVARDSAASSLPAAAAASPASPDGADEQGGVRDIVVTAERRSSTIQKTPIAITAVTGDEVRERQLNSIGDVLAQTPSLVVQNSTKGQAIFVRGIGSTGDAQEGGDPAVNLNIDGVYQQQAVVALASTFDINRIEVLRGPQGTLYGRNSNAGSINIITNDPKLGDTSGFLNVQGGNYAALRGEAAANVAIGDQVAARLAVVGNRHDGYFSNGGNSANGYAVRGKLKAQPAEPLTITVTGLWARETGSPQTTVPAPLNTNDPYNTTYPQYNGMNGNPFFPPLAAHVNPIPASVQNVSVGQVYGQLDYQFGFGTLTILPAYNYTRQYQDTVLVPFVAGVQDVSEQAKSVEARLASRAGASISWVLGAFYYQADDYNHPFSAPSFDYEFRFNPVFPSAQRLDAYTVSKAVFGQVTVPLGDRLRATGGGRYTQDNKGFTFQNFTAPMVASGSPYNLEGTFHPATFKGGAEFDIAPRSLLYAQVSNGFKDGGVNNNGSVYRPEKIIAYEAGIKSRFIDNKVQLNVSGYYYHYTDFQVSQTAPDCSNADGFSGGNQNAGTLNNYGGEAELTIAPTRHDRLYASASYLHARGRFYGDSGACNVTPGSPGYGTISHRYYDRVGSPPNSPTWSGLVSYSHSFDLPAGMTLSGRGDLRWSGPYDTSVDESIYDGQEHFTRTDASLTLASANARYSLRVYVRNIEGKVQKLYTLAPPLPFASLEISDPRTFGVAISAAF